jgi:hypothetical protein
MSSGMPLPLLERFARAEEEAGKFERALGVFIIAFSEAELELYRVVLHYTRVSEAIGRSIFSGVRASAFMGSLRNIAHNTGMSARRRENLDAVLGQLDAILAMRDKLVHHIGEQYGADDPTTRVLTNIDRNNKRGKHFVIRIGSRHILQMVDDLYLIRHHLEAHRYSRFVPWREEPTDETAWRYKSLLPVPQASNKKTPQAQRRQPKASHRR